MAARLAHRCSDPPPAQRFVRIAQGLAYPLSVSATIGLFFIVQSHGSKLSAPPVQISILRNSAAAPQVLLHVLCALLTIVIAARALGAIFKFLGQPPVIGEVLAGIMLGPSFLGWLAPKVASSILPPDSAPFLGLLSQIGVILYMFGVGLELDLRLIRNRGHATVAISHASILFPFALGSVLSLWLYPRFSSSDVAFRNFALFIGVAMSVTAFPVLARILTDRGIEKTCMGVIALACAAVDDVTAWCLLAFIVAVARAQVGHALQTFSMVGSYLAVMFLVVRPILVRLGGYADKKPELIRELVGLLYVLLLLSVALTEAIGIHAVFGAFLFGALIPKESRIARGLAKPIEHFVIVVLLPAYFAFTGMRTQIDLLASGEGWIACAAIILVASLGKFGGSAIAAKLSGLRWRDAASLGILMNTRGLMELVVINIGYDLQVISRTLYAMLVVMAVVTTIATTPILRALENNEPDVDAQLDTERVGVAVSAVDRPSS